MPLRWLGWPDTWSAGMERFTPQALFDLYALSSDEDKIAFLKLLGSISLADAPFIIINELSRIEQMRFTELVFDDLFQKYFPPLLREARKLAREKPDISDALFDKELNERMKQNEE